MSSSTAVSKFWLAVPVNANFVVTDHFGTFRDYSEIAPHKLQRHEGVDLKAVDAQWRPVAVLAAQRGVVDKVGFNPSGYGHYVRIRHEWPDGNVYVTWYGHLQRVDVQERQFVNVGQPIGVAGDTGMADGVHLHLTLQHLGHGLPNYVLDHVLDPEPFFRTRALPDVNKCEFLEDATVPDKTVMPAGQTFEKTWRIRNDGTTAWAGGHELAFFSSEKMGTGESVPMPRAEPGEETTVSVSLTAPAAPGHYYSYWKMRTPDGEFVDKVLWAEIIVEGEPATEDGSTNGFVQMRKGQFVVNGQPFKRFIGVNLQGLIHYGHGDIPEMRHSRHEHAQQQLQAAHEMGTRVVRCFLANHRCTTEEVTTRLRTLLNLMHDHFPDVYIIPVLTNFYHNWGQFVQGDEQFYENLHGTTVLSADFFREGYKRSRYLQYVEQVVKAFRAEPKILAWEIGNELKAEREPESFVQFNESVAARLKEWAPNHMVTTGMKSTQHVWMEGRESLRQQLYGSPNIDFVTVHSYENGSPEEAHGDQAVYADADLARTLGKPVIVEEAGIVKAGLGDRGPALEQHMQKWFDERGAYGYMQWGFDAAGAGDGDANSGMSPSDADWNSLLQRYRARAARLAQES